MYSILILVIVNKSLIIDLILSALGMIITMVEIFILVGALLTFLINFCSLFEFSA